MTEHTPSSTLSGCARLAGCRVMYSMPAAQPASSQWRKLGYPGAGTAGAIPTSSKPSRSASDLRRSVSSWRDIGCMVARG